MNFNSVEFVIFLPICVVLYYLVRPKYRNIYLLASSYFFYMQWNKKYALLLLFSTVITYLCGLMIEKAKRVRIKQLWLIFAIVPNFFILFTFKYLNLTINTANRLFGSSIPISSLLLPVGISFYIFQAVGYAIDVYRYSLDSSTRGGCRAEHNFVTYALFVSFFPQLVAGPIERSSNLLPQFNREISFSEENIVRGCRLILLQISLDRYEHFATNGISISV